MKHKIMLAVTSVALVLSLNSFKKPSEHKTPARNHSVKHVATYRDDYDTWDKDQGKCVTTPERVCCAPPPPPPALPVQTIHDHFVTAFNNNTLSTFFNTENYAAVWPSLVDESTIINGLINGSEKMIKVSTAGIDYYLAGPTSSSYQDIHDAPDLVIYVTW